jgi:hypothetical protein
VVAECKAEDSEETLEAKRQRSEVRDQRTDALRGWRLEGGSIGHRVKRQRSDDIGQMRFAVGGR